MKCYVLSVEGCQTTAHVNGYLPDSAEPFALTVLFAEADAFVCRADGLSASSTKFRAM
jgi:hypothetical protein